MAGMPERGWVGPSVGGWARAWVGGPERGWVLCASEGGISGELGFRHRFEWWQDVK